ncbi:MAG TPA: peptidylprolyl isomerase [Actinomycetota bacterium]|nr:peptidylprolyl isomerase [Actinomycetota bacterium]
MSSRPPKRQRKKDAAAARREAMREMMERQRRRRRIINLSVISALILGGVAIAAVATLGGKEERKALTTSKPKASPSTAPTPAPIACDAPLPEAAGTKKEEYTAAEDQKLNKARIYVWRLETSCGLIDIELDVARAPKTANSIVFLARKGFFDGLTFHRLAKGFVIQGGDPKGDGTGGAGYKVTEAPPKTLKYTEGLVAMAKGGQEAAGTSSSQFFVVTGPGGAGLTPDYALVGKVTAGLDIAKRIEGFAKGGPPGDPGAEQPTAKVYINKSTVVEKAPAASVSPGASGRSPSPRVSPSATRTPSATRR